jgi:hypothetical protein
MVGKTLAKGGKQMRIFISGETDGKISDVIGKLLSEIHQKFKPLESNDYGSEFTNIGIIPIIIDPRRGLFEEGFFKERKLIKRKAREADIRLRTDYNKFFSADYEKKRLLFLENIIRSVRVIGDKSKLDFNAEKLINDIYKLFDIDAKVLENL